MINNYLLKPNYLTIIIIGLTINKIKIKMFVVLFKLVKNMI